MSTELQTALIQIILFIIPILAGLATAFLLTKVKDSGKEDKLQKALAIAQSVIPILINLYKELYKQSPEIKDKTDMISTWFKEYVLKLIPLTDEELNTLWKMCYSKIVEEFEKAGYNIETELELECDFQNIVYEVTQSKKSIQFQN